MKKLMLFCMMIFLISLTACGNTGENITESEIMFMYKTNSNEGENSRYSIKFYDKEGNSWYSDDEYVTSLPFDRLVSEYADGMLNDKLAACPVADKELLSSCFEMLCRDKDIEIESPEVLPAVESEIRTWYGFYYTEDGTLDWTILHKYERGTHLYAVEDSANEIYQYFTTSFTE